MADSTIHYLNWHLMLEASEFAFAFALFNDLLSHECVAQMAVSGIARLPSAIRQKNLDHDWYHVFYLKDILTCEADYAAFEALCIAAIKRIMNAGQGVGVPLEFYQNLPNAKFAPPHNEGVHWRVVAWPFIQIVAAPILRTRLSQSEFFLNMLEWVAIKN